MPEDSGTASSWWRGDLLGRRHQIAAGTITAVCLLILAGSWIHELRLRGRMIDIDRPNLCSGS